MYLDLGRWINRVCMVLEWALTIDLLCCSVSLHLKGTWETQNHQTFCMRLVLACIIIIETLHDQSFSLTSEDRLQTTGTVMTSQCMKLVLVSFTLIYSATCALLSFHIKVCAGCMCFTWYLGGES